VDDCPSKGGETGRGTGSEAKRGSLPSASTCDPFCSTVFVAAAGTPSKLGLECVLRKLGRLGCSPSPGRVIGLERDVGLLTPGRSEPKLDLG
jgi:hypothetical protein